MWLLSQGRLSGILRLSSSSPIHPPLTVFLFCKDEKTLEDMCLRFGKPSSFSSFCWQVRWCILEWRGNCRTRLRWPEDGFLAPVPPNSIPPFYTQTYFSHGLTYCEDPPFSRYNSVPISIKLNIFFCLSIVLNTLKSPKLLEKLMQNSQAQIFWSNCSQVWSRNNCGFWEHSRWF